MLNLRDAFRGFSETLNDAAAGYAGVGAALGDVALLDGFDEDYLVEFDPLPDATPAELVSIIHAHFSGKLTLPLCFSDFDDDLDVPSAVRHFRKSGSDDRLVCKVVDKPQVNRLRGLVL